MRTTVDLDPDVRAAADALRRARGLGLSEALNELARAGIAAPTARKPFRQRTAPLGVRIDITDVAEALALLDEDDGRA